MGADCRITVLSPRGSRVADMNSNQLHTMSLALRRGSVHMNGNEAKDVIWLANKIDQLLEVR